MKNEKARTRNINAPYEIYVSGSWEWRVLKHYQGSDKEKTNPYARVFCAVKSPFTEPNYDLGDTYISDIKGIQLSENEIDEHVKKYRW